MRKAVPETIPQKSLPSWLLFVAAAALVNLGYALYTGHMWEDFFITFQHSRNLCEGHGLVYRPGERVHGFTSPLGVLGLAFGYLLTGRSSYLATLWVFRILSIAAFAGGGLLLLRTIKEDGATRPALITLAVLYLLDAKAVAFSMNGMETAFMLLFLAWGFYLSNTSLTQHWRPLGLCWAGLMWTRPDGCVFIVALTVASLLFLKPPRREVLTALGKSAAICTALYLPWFAWAWWYYGSPVPHTITAKAFLSDKYYETTNTPILLNGFGQLTHWSAEVFRPIYSALGGWSPFVGVAGTYLGLVSAFYWLVPVQDRTGRMASLCFMIVCFYFALMAHAAPWYQPSATVFGLVVWSKGLFSYAGFLRDRFAAATRIATGVATIVCVGWACVFVLSTLQMAVQQRVIESGNRQQIGLWLKDRVKQGERIYLEPLGYIGFFSGAKMLDYPGLGAPEVVQAQKEGVRGFIPVGLHLKPEWMVLRPKKRRICPRAKSSQRIILLSKSSTSQRSSIAIQASRA